MIIYIDVIFLENLIMNLAIIVSEAICLNATDKKIRKIIASFVCSFFYIMQLVFPQISIFQLIIAIFTMMIAFGKSGLKNVIKQVLLFYFISFLFGGVSFALMSLINRGNYSIINGIIVGKFGIEILIVSGILAFVFVVIFLKNRKRHIIKNIVISIDKNEVKIRVLLDTGNLLREPFKNRPVIVVEKYAVKELLDKYWIFQKNKIIAGNISIKENENIFDDIDLILSGNKEVPFGMFLIPYKSVGNARGMLLGMVPDYILVKESGRKYENVVIGVCSDYLSEGGNYNGIFGLDSLDGGSI